MFSIAHLTHVCDRVVHLIATSSKIRQVLDMALATLIAPSRPVLLEIVICSKETSNVAAHIEKSCILVVEGWAFVRNAIIHGMITKDLTRVPSVKLTLQISTVLREMRLVIMRMARSTM